MKWTKLVTAITNFFSLMGFAIGAVSSIFPIVAISDFCYGSTLYLLYDWEEKKA